MNRFRTAAVLILTLAASTGSAKAQGTGAFAELRPIDRSGIRALLAFEDSGSTLMVNGIATGMDPMQVYISLVYDEKSVPRGSKACLPRNNSLTFPQMVLGVWLPLGSSTRTLSVVKAGPSYVPLFNVGTASVRLDTMPLSPPPTAPDPVRFRLQACGRVVPYDF